MYLCRNLFGTNKNRNLLILVGGAAVTEKNMKSRIQIWIRCGVPTYANISKV
jgi:hypothetical protein